MRVAIECAGFTPGEADQLRRAMATFKFTGGVTKFKDKLVDGMVERGYPDVFCESLLNAQPMGFYAPAQIVRDARDHGVEIRPVCIDASRWDCTLEPIGGDKFALRLGFRQVRGLANKHGAKIIAARADQPFESVDDLWRRADVPFASLFCCTLTPSLNDRY